ncbi:MAG: anthranilate synthase component I family protein [Chitinophagaceae bacterium]|nr:anthranilate synthase component I family protein [Chitinophagaceae bacterium]
MNFSNALSTISIDNVFRHYDTVCVFDSNANVNSSQPVKYKKIIAAGCLRKLLLEPKKAALSQLQEFIDHKNSWLFGFISYDLKNELEQLYSKNFDGLNFPLICFFEPEFVVEICNDFIEIHYDDQLSGSVDDLITKLVSGSTGETSESIAIPIKPRMSKEQYLAAVNALKEHIKRGDIYEVNYCQEFYAEQVKIDPLQVFKKLNAISSAPFACYFKFENYHLMSSSPERFLKKEGGRLISQPIKGTAKRSSNEEEDQQLKGQLKQDPKERSENVMIVDLVRNDLSKLAQRGSVKVDELFGVYTFKQVHQMISTISCDLKPDLTFEDIIKATFPMGSMTGAPKHSAMQLIEKYEKTKRGLYSGTVGYIAPKGDFDFNVVIRSILYNSKDQYLSFSVGSAITDKADAKDEYEECMIKAKAMFDVLQKDSFLI